MQDDTIVAISTPIGESAIGIVRMSGRDSLKIVDKIFKGRDGVLPSKFKSHTVRYGWIIQKTEVRKQKSERIDEVLLTVMRAPKTYTREDIVEISCHGGAMALRKILELVLRCGVRLAEPGEFTKRAFLNGRIDLSKAEAVLDIIKSKTDTALKLSIEQLSGGLSEKIKQLRKELIDILARIEAGIDFPDEDIDICSNKALRNKLESVIESLENIIQDSQKVNFFREGIKVTICGRPNVGKSSLLNALLKKERAIVTPIAGTTRDIIEEFINIDGIGIRLVDTAGVVRPKNLIEHHAVRLAKDSIALSDIVLLVFDSSQKLTKRDYQLIKELKAKDAIAVLNKIDTSTAFKLRPSGRSRNTPLSINPEQSPTYKSGIVEWVDLPMCIQKDKIKECFKHIVAVSALKQINIEKLEKTITSFVYKGKITSSEGLITTNARQIGEITKTKDLLDKAKDSFSKKLSLEFIALDLKLALDCLGRITGEAVDGAILEKIFSEFCIGK